MNIIGHIIGFISTALLALSYQIFDKKKLIAVQTVATALSCVQYILIGALSGATLNIVCIVRNLVFYNRDKKFLSGKWIPFFTAAVMAGVSAFSWDGPHSLFIISGLVINTVCMGLCDSNNLRKSITVTSPLVFIYNVFERSYSGMATESLSFCSAVIGIVRYMRTKNQPHQSKVGGAES